MKGFGFSIILLTCFLLIGNVSAVLGYTCGVRSGDYMRYNVSILGPVRSDSIKGSIKLTIQSVGCPHVSGTYEASVQGYSVTPQPEPFSLDISAGIGEYGGHIIPANLTFGNTIPGEGTTVQSIVDWGERKAIQANATSPFSGLEGQICWDQLTGVLLEAKSSTGGTYTYSIVLAKTNMWSGAFSGWWILIVIAAVVAVILTVTVLMLRRKKTLSNQSSTRVHPPPPPLPTAATPACPAFDRPLCIGQHQKGCRHDCKK